MEFAVRDDLQLYSGGLGILAGDVLHAAADLGLPYVGVGLLWSEGYVTQRVDAAGAVSQEWRALPREALEPLPVEVEVEIRGRAVPLRAFRLDGPHAPLFLLEPRDEADRWITRRLYQGGSGDRIAQELVLGAGGVRLLRALGHAFDVVHLNEGHALFAALELVRERMGTGVSFRDAVASARHGVVFTTHTPVLAGNEAHDLGLLLEWGATLGTFSREDLFGLAGDPFSMTVAGLRLSGRANAVARLHARTARRMWADVDDAAPIEAITNGVHVPTWQDDRMRRAFAGGDPWAAHAECKDELRALVRARTGVELAADSLVIGFARRATPYKRADLILRDLERLRPLVESGRLQLVFAGKAFPDDSGGQGIVHHLLEVARRFPSAIAFVPNHERDVGRAMTRGCDVWLNTPLRPCEASGTSGMKAALNGVLNLSVLDGWWAEACEHGVNGWQVGDGYEGPGQDEHDHEALFRVLEGEVLPTYFDHRARWVEMMRAAEVMARTRFSAARMLADYRDRLHAR